MRGQNTHDHSVRRYGSQDYVHEASSLRGREKQRLGCNNDENTPTGLRIQHLEQVSELLDESRLLISGSINQADGRGQ